MRPPYSFEDVARQIMVRAIEDAVTGALPDAWERRAATFEAARPRPGDFTGRATPADLAALDARLVATAQACRRAAAVARTTSPWWLPSTLSDVFEGVAA